MWPPETDKHIEVDTTIPYTSAKCLMFPLTFIENDPDVPREDNESTALHLNEKLRDRNAGFRLQPSCLSPYPVGTFYLEVLSPSESLLTIEFPTTPHHWALLARC